MVRNGRNIGITEWWKNGRSRKSKDRALRGWSGKT
jgi:hypothetical protein